VTLAPASTAAGVASAATGPFLARRPTVTTWVRGVGVGSSQPVVVQSMTNTDTADALATAAQVAALYQAGSQIVRITVNNDEAAAAVPEIRQRLDDLGLDVPLVGDFHYNGHLLLTKFPGAARDLDAYRINPGNVGTRHRDANFTQIVQVAVDHRKPVRIGVNWGSLDQDLLTTMMDENAAAGHPREAKDVYIEAMLASALRSAELAEDVGLPHDHIVISAKVSVVPDLVEVYRRLARRCDYPLTSASPRRGWGPRASSLHRRAVDPARRRDRRHDPCLADAQARRRPHRGGVRRAADPAVARHAQLRPAGDRVPRVRAHDVDVLPAHGRGHPDLPARADAGLEADAPGRGRHERRRDGMRGERPRREQARQHRASRSPAPSRSPRRRCTWTGGCSRRSRASGSCPSSSRSSTTTWRGATARARPRCGSRWGLISPRPAGGHGTCAAG
jgi:hypothetical protein